MADLALTFPDLEIGVADLVFSGGGLATDDGLRSAIVISLFSDARASADDGLAADADRRGWWGDLAPEVERDETGSKLWLLEREKVVARALASARDFAAAALAWLVDDGIAASVDVDAAADGATLLLGVDVVRPSGGARRRFDFVWAALA